MCTVLLPPGVYPIVVKYIISYHIISYHIISYHIISYHIISYHISHISYHIISYHIPKSMLFRKPQNIASVHAICPAHLILLELTSLVTYRLVVYSSVPKMETVGLVDTSVHFYQIKRRYIPEDRSLLLLYLAGYAAAHSSVL